MVDENTKLRQEDGPENDVPHFYADYELIQELFSDFEIVDVHQYEEFLKKEGTQEVLKSWHYHMVIRKTD